MSFVRFIRNHSAMRSSTAECSLRTPTALTAAGAHYTPAALRPVCRTASAHRLSEQKKGAAFLGDPFFLAPVARFELATRGLTVRCSDRLSYTGINFQMEPSNFERGYLAPFQTHVKREFFGFSAIPSPPDPLHKSLKSLFNHRIVDRKVKEFPGEHTYEYYRWNQKRFSRSIEPARRIYDTRSEDQQNL